MDVTGLIIFLTIGAIAVWLAGTFMQGAGFGLIGNIIIGHNIWRPDHLPVIRYGVFRLLLHRKR